MRTLGFRAKQNIAVGKRAKTENQREKEIIMSRRNQSRSCILEFDGASSGNPGKSGAGAVLRSADGQEVHSFSKGLGTQTNNSAEYQGLILGLNEARNQGYEHVQVRGDSKLVCNQFDGQWKVNNQNLRNLCNEAQELKSNFKSVTVEHVPRGSNSEADRAANLGKNLGAGQVEGGFSVHRRY